MAEDMQTTSEQPQETYAQPHYANPTYTQPQQENMYGAPQSQYGQAYGQSYGQPHQQQYQQPQNFGYQQAAVPAGSKDKVIAGILGILLGALGIHKFYLGYTKEGLIMLLVTILTFGIAGFVMGVIGLVEGILYLTKDDAEFYATYVAGHKGWF